MIKKHKRSKFSHVRHPFLYHMIIPATGEKLVKRAMARVILGKKYMEIILTAEFVRESMKLGGMGRTDICPGAICTVRNASAFSHPVTGHVDFTYTRFFPASKLNKYGLPCECYAYEHNRADIAKLNDSKNGQRKLLKLIERNGPITIKLKPYRKRSEEGRPGRGRKSTGARVRAFPATGANLRHLVAQAGGYPS
jgi:hypothetical protein